MAITRFLAKRISNYHNPHSVGSSLRRKRAATLKAMIEEIYSKKGLVRIIDVGGTRRYWNIIESDYLASKNCQITLVNFTKSDDPEDSVFWEVIGDGRHLDVEDYSFDIAHSNSVIEHVGSWDDMLLFSKEIARVSKNYFVQTPSFWFPIEPHAMFPFFHWLPVPLRKMIVTRYAIGHWEKATSNDKAASIVSSASLLKKYQMKLLFPEAVIKTEWLLFPKSYIAIKT